MTFFCRNAEPCKEQCAECRAVDEAKCAHGVSDDERCYECWPVEDDRNIITGEPC